MVSSLSKKNPLKESLTSRASRYSSSQNRALLLSTSSGITLDLPPFRSSQGHTPKDPNDIISPQYPKRFLIDTKTTHADQSTAKKNKLSGKYIKTKQSDGGEGHSGTYSLGQLCHQAHDTPSLSHSLLSVTPYGKEPHFIEQSQNGVHVGLFHNGNFTQRSTPEGMVPGSSRFGFEVGTVDRVWGG